MQRRWWIFLGYTLIVLALGSAAGAVHTLPAAARAAGALVSGGQEPDVDNYSLLLELSERLLGANDGPGQARLAQVLPGELPQDLPLDLPLPPGSQLIGSAVHATVGPPLTSPGPLQSGEHVDIVLDVPGSAADAVSFYRDALTGLGWSAPAPLRGPPGLGFGFGFSTPPSPPTPASTATPTPAVQYPNGIQSVTLCQSADGPSFQLTVYPASSGPNDALIRIDTANAFPCSGPPVLLGQSLIPLLTAPDGVQILPGGGGGSSSGDGSSNATATTDMTTAGLEAFYAQQLQAAGWTQTESQNGDSLSWSTWSLPARDGWQGFLYVRVGAAQNQRLLHVEVLTPAQAFQPPSSSAIYHFGPVTSATAVPGGMTAVWAGVPPPATPTPISGSP